MAEFRYFRARTTPAVFFRLDPDASGEGAVRVWSTSAWAVPPPALTAEALLAALLMAVDEVSASDLPESVDASPKPAFRISIADRFGGAPR